MSSTERRTSAAAEITAVLRRSGWMNATSGPLELRIAAILTKLGAFPDPVDEVGGEPPVGYAFQGDLDRMKNDPTRTWRVDMRAEPQGSVSVPLFRHPIPRRDEGQRLEGWAWNLDMDRPGVSLSEPLYKDELKAKRCVLIISEAKEVGSEP